MSYESFSKDRMRVILDRWIDQFDDTVQFILPNLNNDAYDHKFTIISVDINITN